MVGEVYLLIVIMELTDYQELEEAEADIIM